MAALQSSGTPVAFAVAALVGAFLLGQRMGQSRLDDGADSAGVMAPW